MMKQINARLTYSARKSIRNGLGLALIVLSVSFVACGKKGADSGAGQVNLQDTGDSNAITDKSKDQNVNESGRVYTSYSGSNLSDELEKVRGTQYRPQPFIKSIDKISAVISSEVTVKKVSGSTEVVSGQSPASGVTSSAAQDSGAPSSSPSADSLERVSTHQMDVSILSKDGSAVHYVGEIPTPVNGVSKPGKLLLSGNAPADLANTFVESTCLTDGCTGTENKINNASGVTLAGFSTSNETRRVTIWPAGDPAQAVTVDAQVQSSEVVEGAANISLALNSSDPIKIKDLSPSDIQNFSHLQVSGDLVETAGDCVKLKAQSPNSNSVQACMLGNSGNGDDVPIAVILPAVAKPVLVAENSIPPRPRTSPQASQPPEPPVVQTATVTRTKSEPAKSEPSKSEAATPVTAGADSASPAKDRLFFISLQPRQNKKLNSVSARANAFDLLDDSELPYVCRKESRDQAKDELVKQILENCRRRMVRDYIGSYWMKNNASDLRGILAMSLNEPHVANNSEHKEDLPAFHTTIKALKEIEIHPVIMSMTFSESRFFNDHPKGNNHSAGRWQQEPVFARAHHIPLQPRDMRYDPVVSAQASGNYVKSLMNRPGREGRYEFVLATYNCGEGCMNGMVDRFAKDKDLGYWDMLKHGMFRTKTTPQGYAARILSASVMWLAPQEFNLTSPISGKAIPALDASSVTRLAK